jgi:hypothetical protein
MSGNENKENEPGPSSSQPRRSQRRTASQFDSTANSTYRFSRANQTMMEIESKKKILDKLDKKRELEGEEEMTLLTQGIANYEELREVHREDPTAEIFVRDSADIIKRLNIFGKDASEFDFKIGKYFF